MSKVISKHSESHAAKYQITKHRPYPQDTVESHPEHPPDSLLSTLTLFAHQELAPPPKFPAGPLFTKLDNKCRRPHELQT
jgi:hypothetical protein